jgi:hypothetical protein
MTAPTIIDGAVGVDVTQVTSPSTLRFPPFRLGTTVRGSDGSFYLYVTASELLTAGVGNSATGLGMSILNVTNITINTALAQDIVITGQLQDATDTITLNSFIVEFIPG